MEYATEHPECLRVVLQSSSQRHVVHVFKCLISSNVDVDLGLEDTVGSSDDEDSFTVALPPTLILDLAKLTLFKLQEVDFHVIRSFLYSLCTRGLGNVAGVHKHWIDVADCICSEEGRDLTSRRWDLTSRRWALACVKTATEETPPRATSRRAEAAEEQLRATPQHAEAAEEQLRATRQRAEAAEEQLRATRQRAEAAEEQLRATRQRAEAAEDQCRATRQRAYSAEVKLRATRATVAEQQLRATRVTVAEQQLRSTRIVRQRRDRPTPYTQDRVQVRRRPSIRLVSY
jgi:hypothetical protein